MHKMLWTIMTTCQSCHLFIHFIFVSLAKLYCCKSFQISSQHLFILIIIILVLVRLTFQLQRVFWGKLCWESSWRKVREVLQQTFNCSTAQNHKKHFINAISHLCSAFLSFQFHSDWWFNHFRLIVTFRTPDLLAKLSSVLLNFKTLSCLMLMYLSQSI